MDRGCSDEEKQGSVGVKEEEDVQDTRRQLIQGKEKGIHSRELGKPMLMEPMK